MAALTKVELVDKVNAIPEDLIDEVGAVVDEVLAAHREPPYRPTPEESEGIERGIRAANEGRYATQQQVDEVLAKFRR